MADEKKIRTSMGAVETAKMLLMPVSQAIAWTVLRGELSGFGFEVPLTQRLVPIALFYGSWATIKRVYGDKNERGHVSMGALLVCLTTRNPALAALGCTGDARAFRGVAGLGAPQPILGRDRLPCGAAGSTGFCPRRAQHDHDDGAVRGEFASGQLLA